MHPHQHHVINWMQLRCSARCLRSVSVLHPCITDRQLSSLHPTCVTNPMPSRVQDTIPVPNLTNNPFHALANDDDENKPSATTWVPPPLPTSVPRTPAPRARITPLLQAPPTNLSLMTLNLQVDPLQPQNQAHHHFQGCWQHQALLLIAQGHVLHHRTTVPWRHLYNTIS
jgi:hypothetical protein